MLILKFIFIVIVSILSLLGVLSLLIYVRDNAKSDLYQATNGRRRKGPNDK